MEPKFENFDFLRDCQFYRLKTEETSHITVRCGAVEIYYTINTSPEVTEVRSPGIG